MGSITELARDAIDSSNYYFSAAECLEYLDDKYNFKSVDYQLKEAVQYFCQHHSDLPDMSDIDLLDLSKETLDYMIDLLTDRILALDPSANVKRNNFRKKIASWFHGRVKTISREAAIMVCFALEMNVTQATDFLRKGCNLSGFNVRNSTEAIWLYCIVNRRPYSTISLLEKALEEHITTDNEQTESIEHVTQVMSSLLTNSIWDTDQDFLDTFLLKHKTDFIGYSQTLIRQYYHLKNNILATLLREEIRPRFYTKIRTTSYSVDTDETTGYTLLLPKYESFLQTLQQRKDISEEEKGILAKLGTINSLEKFETSWEITQKACEESLYHIFEAEKTGKAAKNTVQKLLFDEISMDAFLKNVFRDYNGLLSGKITVSSQFDSDSAIHSIFDLFPRRQNISDFEDKPFKNANTNIIRKLLILLFFINYTYAWDPNDDSCPDVNYEDFYEKLSDLLDDCMLAQIYPADPFDWFIIRSIRAFEDTDITDASDDPLAFFFNILDETLSDEDLDITKGHLLS